MKQINVVPMTNPHEKMEGIQKVNPQEIKKMLDKAIAMPSKQEGGFVPIQNYTFKVDEFEEMDAVDKKVKKPQAKDKKPQEKKEQAKLNPKKKEIVEQETVEEPQNDEYNEVTKSHESIKEEEEQEQIEKESEVDLEDMHQVMQEDNLDQDEQNVSQEEVQNEENNEDEYKEPSEQDQEQPEQENQSQLQSSLQASRTLSKSKYRSEMAALMEDLLDEEQPQPKSTLKVKKQDKLDNKSDVKETQKLTLQEMLLDDQKDKNEVIDYLKAIKQYQLKIKKLNKQLELKQQLEVVDEEDPQINQSYQKKHIYPAQPELNIYDEFKLPLLVEEQVQQRLAELGVSDRENELLQKELQLKQLEQEHESEIKRLKQQYAVQLQELQKQLDQKLHREISKISMTQQSLVSVQNSSGISDGLNSTERRQLQNSDQIKAVSSGIDESCDSSLAEILKNDSLLKLKYQKLITRTKRPQDCLDIVNSRVYPYVTPEEADQFAQIEIDSNLSIEQLMGLDSALRLLQEDSRITNLITSQERREFQADPRFNEQTLPNSDISDLSEQNSKLKRLIDSDIENMNFAFNEDDVYYQQLEQSLEQKYGIVKHNKVEIYKAIADYQKNEYEKQIKKLDQVVKQPIASSYRSSQQSINSSIGSLANQTPPVNISSSIENSSLISQFVSPQEKQQFQSQMSEQSSNVDVTQKDSDFIDSDVLISSDNSSISKLIASEEKQQFASQLDMINSQVSQSYQESMNSSVSISKIQTNKAKNDTLSISYQSSNSCRSSVHSFLRMKNSVINQFK